MLTAPPAKKPPTTKSTKTETQPPSKGTPGATWQRVCVDADTNKRPRYGE